MTNPTTGMLLSGVFASEALDSSSEVMSISGANLDTMHEGRGTVNYEHRSADKSTIPAEEAVGKVVMVKKIFKASDCDTDDQRKFWDKLKLPFIYGIVRLYDGAGHPGAQNVASVIRDSFANNEPLTIGWSIEGSTLERKENRLISTVCKRVALTFSPCNKTATLNLLADPNAPEGFDKAPKDVDMLKEEPDLLYQRLGGYSYNLSQTDLDDLQKALSAGVPSGAPSSLVDGAALQVEDRGRVHKAIALAAMRDWPKTGKFRDYLKSQLPDVSDDFLEHFTNIVDNHQIRLKKTQEAISDLRKAGQEVKEPKIPKTVWDPVANIARVNKEHPDYKAPEQGVSTKLAGAAPKPRLTIMGKKVSPRPSVKQPYFKDGTLHTSRGSFPMYIPQGDELASFEQIWNRPDIEHFHSYATNEWARAHKMLKSGTLPPEVVHHAMVFSSLGPNCLDAETEALTQRGWVKGFDLTRDDWFLTKNSETGGLEWQQPTDLRLFPDYEGPMVEFKSRSFYALTTPDHEWLVTTGRGHLRIKKSTEITQGDKIHRTGNYAGAANSGLTPDEAELLGWFVTDGHYTVSKVCNGGMLGKGNSKYEKPGTYALLNQSILGNPEKCARIDALLARLSEEVTSAVGADGKKVWRLGPKLTKMLLFRAPDRHLTVASLVDLSQEALLRLREGMVLGDGHVWAGVGKTEALTQWTPKECLVTGRKEQADAFQVLLSMTGSASSVVWRDMSMYHPKSEKMNNIPKMTGCYVVTALKRKYVRVDPEQRTDLPSVKVGVWCPILPNHFFVARRSGHVFITKNTPVPTQENMYGHMVDAMRHTGEDFLSDDEGKAKLKRDWLGRDTPAKFPDHSPEHWRRIEHLLRLGNDAKDSGRKSGQIGSFMLADSKFDKMANHYGELHGPLVDAILRNGRDVRNTADEVLHFKRLEEANKGYEGPSLKGWAPKTTRYALGMMGGGNVVVPDTHFVRYLFGLDRNQDGATIDHLKSQLWNPNNHHILNAIDQHYAQHHPAVRLMQQHPTLGKHFEHPEDAVFPAFWRNWMAILPHEQARGIKTAGFNELTDHKPFWEHIQDMTKAEPQHEALRTASQHHRWVQDHGLIPAQMLYAAYILPQQLNSHIQKMGQQLVRKAQSLTVDMNLRKAAPEIDFSQAKPDPEDPKGFKTLVEYNGRLVSIGRIQNKATHKTDALLEAGPNHFVTVPFPKNLEVDHEHEGEQVYKPWWQPHEMQKIPRHSGPLETMKGRFNVLYPSTVGNSSKIDANRHGVGDYLHHDDIKQMVDGFDFNQPKVWSDEGVQKNTSFWGKTKDGKPVYVKRAPEETVLNGARKEGLAHNLAKDFFGMGEYFPKTAVVRHPQDGSEWAIIEGHKGTHMNHSRIQADHFARHKAVKMLKPLDSIHDSGDLDKLAVMNYLWSNADRHHKNFLYTSEGGLKMLDHGHAFHQDNVVHYHNLHGRGAGFAGYLDDAHWRTQQSSHIGNARDPSLQPLHYKAIDWANKLDPNELNMHLVRHDVPEHIRTNMVGRLKALQHHLSLPDAAQQPKLHLLADAEHHMTALQSTATTPHVDAADVPPEAQPSIPKQTTPDKGQEKKVG